MIVQSFARKIEEGHASELPDLHAHTGTNTREIDKQEILKSYE